MTHAPRLWFDVEDLFDFAERNARPSGIQRVCYEIYRAALADPAMSQRIGFVRHAHTERGFVEADWDMLAFRFRQVTDRPAAISPEPELPSTAAGEHPPQSKVTQSVVDHTGHLGRPWPVRLLRRAGRMVPPRLARPGFLFLVMQAQAGAALADTVRLTVVDRARRIGVKAAHRVLNGVARLPLMHRPEGQQQAIDAEPLPVVARRLDEIAQRGDVLVVLGSPWFDADYAELAAYARGRLGLRVAVLMHDVIPVRRPEWVDRGTVRVFRHWYRTVLPLADLVMANSQSTADDVAAWCLRDNIRLNGPVRPVPIGTGFGPALAVEAERAPSIMPTPLLGRLGRRPYVLFVSTIEARKNHMLLFRVWRRLLAELPANKVPDLVFAGRVGWLVDDLMGQIENSRYLDGRLHVIQGLDDAALRAVYDSCLFTVFPSFYEGWGLPVSESLSMGRPCICSNATSLPEAGGTLARYFDPFDLNDATRVIRDVITDGAGLLAWRDQVEREFEPVGWDKTVTALLDAVDETV